MCEPGTKWRRTQLDGQRSCVYCGGSTQTGLAGPFLVSMAQLLSPLACPPADIVGELDGAVGGRCCALLAARCVSVLQVGACTGKVRTAWC
jgi:hypothetical protein